MATDKFEEWWREKGNLYECLDYEAKEIWDAAIKSVEVQKPSHNKQSTPCPRIPECNNGRNEFCKTCTPTCYVKWARA